jgi:hypothetical protein
MFHTLYKIAPKHPQHKTTKTPHFLPFPNVMNTQLPNTTLPKVQNDDRNSAHSMRRCSSMHPRGLGLGFFSFEEGDGGWNFRV